MGGRLSGVHEGVHELQDVGVFTEELGKLRGVMQDRQSVGPISCIPVCRCSPGLRNVLAGVIGAGVIGDGRSIGCGGGRLGMVRYLGGIRWGNIARLGSSSCAAIARLRLVRNRRNLRCLVVHQGFLPAR